MPDSSSTAAERGKQRAFSKSLILQGLLIAAGIVAAHALFAALPTRRDLGAETVPVRFEPVDFGPRKVAGAWVLHSPSRRLEGISGIQVDGDALVALTDSGVVARLPKPGGGGQAWLRDLPAGPGSPSFKRNRDSEALLRDSLGGWWVAFERRDELWNYDRDFKRALKRVRLLGSGWPRNAGIEALAGAGGVLFAIPETRAEVIRIDPGRAVRRLAIAGLDRRVSEALALPEGGLLVVERGFTAAGFVNSLAWLAPHEGGYGVVGRTRLPVAAYDNVEAMAVEPLAGGGARLWLVTDDGHPGPARALLMALDFAAPDAARRD